MSKVSQIPLHPKWKHMFLTKKKCKKKNLQKCLKNFSWLIGGGHFLGKKKNLDLESPSQTTKNPGLSPFFTPSALRALANLQTFFKSWSSDKKIKQQRQRQVASISSDPRHQTESNLVTFWKFQHHQITTVLKSYFTIPNQCCKKKLFQAGDEKNDDTGCCKQNRGFCCGWTQVTRKDIWENFLYLSTSPKNRMVVSRKMGSHLEKKTNDHPKSCLGCPFIYLSFFFWGGVFQKRNRNMKKILISHGSKRLEVGTPTFLRIYGLLN